MRRGEPDAGHPLLRPLVYSSPGYYFIASLLLAVVAWGVYAYTVQLRTGLGVTGMRSIVSWGVYIVNFVFFIGISHVGALMSAILRLTETEWRKPITRAAEVITFASLMVAALMPIIDLGRPDRVLNIPIFARIQSPLIWDAIAIGTYFVGSTLFLYLPLIPDIAACRDRLPQASKLKRRLYQILSLGWRGTEVEMKYLEKAIKTMAIIIIPIAISVHTVVSWDFAMTLRTGWHSTIFGPYFVGGALLSGVAGVITAMVLLRKFYHLEHYFTKRHFDNMAKLLLALDIILIYLTINEFLVPGYKFLQRENLEGQWLSSLLWGRFAPLFWIQIVFGLIIPAAIVAIPRTRTITGYLLASLLVNLGLWLERYDIVVPSLALPQLDYPWGFYMPTWVEVSITAAAFAGFSLIYIIFTKLFPIVSIWETEGVAVTPEAVEVRVPALVPVPQAGRRRFLRTALLSAGSFIIGLASLRLARAALRLAGVASAQTPHDLTPTGSLWLRVPASQLPKHTSMPITPLETLPGGGRLVEARVGDGGRVVGLLYAQPGLPGLPVYGEDVAVAVFCIHDPNGAPPAYMPPGFRRVEVGGRAGFAREPFLKAPGGSWEPGQIQWWSRGVKYAVFAYLSLGDLLRTAEAIEVGAG